MGEFASSNHCTTQSLERREDIEQRDALEAKEFTMSLYAYGLPLATSR